MSPLPPHPLLQPPRLGPRPLPLHMAVETWITQLSFAALTLSSGVLPPWKGPLPATPSLPNLLPNLLPRALQESQPGADPKQLDPIRLVNAVTVAAKTRIEAFATGVARYHASPVPERLIPPDPVWREGVASLRAYSEAGPPVLVVPSLINRATVLDLAADRSFLRDLAAGGCAVYLLDWGEPGAAERGFSSSDYVTRVLTPALRQVQARHGRPAHLIGYCMGGTLAMASAVLAPECVASLTLLAVPWDFHADSSGPRRLLPVLRPLVETILGAHGVAPIDLLQALFALLDPSLVGRKFRAYAAMPTDSEEAKRFVALEDWLNDGVPLAAPLAREVLFAWYGENTPAQRRWQIGGQTIDPARVRAPALAVVPSQDRIVPPASAEALARALPNATIKHVPLGHIGMIASGGARAQVTQPLLAWLRALPT